MCVMTSTAGLHPGCHLESDHSHFGNPHRFIQNRKRSRPGAEPARFRRYAVSLEYRRRVSERVPDAKTIWLFRERLTQAGAIDVLFNRFDTTLRNAGYLPMSGQILDATLVAAPKQRNTNDEKTDLREGRIPQD